MWITRKPYHPEWWTQKVDKNTVSCSDEELEEFLIKGRVLALNHYATRDHRDKITDQGIVSKMYATSFVIEMYTWKPIAWIHLHACHFVLHIYMHLYSTFLAQ